MRLGVCLVEQLNKRHSYSGITSGKTIQICSIGILKEEQLWVNEQPF